MGYGEESKGLRFAYTETNKATINRDYRFMNSNKKAESD